MTPAKTKNHFSIDPTAIAVHEREIREYRIKEWLQEGRSREEMIELCLASLFAEQPFLQRVALKIFKRQGKEAILTYILHSGVKGRDKAEEIYRNLSKRIEVANNIIDDFCGNAPGIPTAFQTKERAGFVSKAAVLPMTFTYEPEYRLITRPFSISVCAILLFISAAAFLFLVIGENPIVAPIQEKLGTFGIIASIVFTFVCGFGYWNMNRWAVLLYAVEPLLRYFAGLSTAYIAVPALIVMFGIIHFDDMTWK